MKGIITFFLGLLLPATSVAQSYDELWEQTRKAAGNDLPASALENVRQIRQKAVAEKNDAQLLKAVLMERIYGGEISPDSATAVVGQMEQALSEETRPVVKALWHSALAQVYEPAHRWRFSSEVEYEENLQKSRNHFEASLTDCEALAGAKTHDWLPLFVEGGGSKYFNGDLLHVLFNTYAESVSVAETRKQEMRASLISLYQRLGNAEATLLLTLDSLELKRQECVVREPLWKNALYREYEALAKTYEKCPLCVRVYEEMTKFADCYNDESHCAYENDSLLLNVARNGIEFYGTKKGDDPAALLRNFISSKEQPSATFWGFSQTYMPGVADSVALHVRNLEHLKLRVMKLSDSRAESDGWNEKQIKRLVGTARKQAQTVNYDINYAPAYIWQDIVEPFTAPSEPGVYYAELLIDNKVCDHLIFSVSALRPIVFSAQGDKCRIVVVDSRTGQPVPNVKITAYSNHPKRQMKAWTTDESGQVLVEADNSRRSLDYYASTATDKSSQSFSLPYYGYYRREDSSKQRAATVVNLFTDRAIYRPGQTVQFSGTVFTRQGDDFRAENGWEAKVTLYNVNRKTVDTLLVKTDAFGTFNGAFTLPAAVLPGNFKLEAGNGSASGSKYFKVEEYKRPTFTAETQPVTSAYALGDTVQVEGVANTYSGVPVAGAKVKYTVDRGRWYWRDNDTWTQTGETVTDNEGKFTIPVVLQANDLEREPYHTNWFYYTANYTVTAENGETAEGSATLHAAAWKTRIDLKMDKKLCKEHLPEINIRQLNAADANVDGEGLYEILPADSEKDAEALLRGNFRFGKPFAIEGLKNLPSGRYMLQARPAIPNSENNHYEDAQKDFALFYLFSETDTSLKDALLEEGWEETFTLFTYSRESVEKDSTFIMIGTPEKDAVLFYDLLANGKTVESRRIALSDSIFHLNLAYKPEYGDGAKAFFALVRKDTLYTFEASVQKPEPDKRLELCWSSFRSRLVPGQAEEWTLKVVRPDGTPADALVMAGMYDASLDAFAKNRWTFDGIFFNRYLPHANWSWTNPRSYHGLSLSGTKEVKYHSVPDRILTQWRGELFNYDYGYGWGGSVNGLGVSGPRKMRAYAAAVQNATCDAFDSSTAETFAASPVEAKMAVMEDAADEAGSAGTTAATPRTNFAETAFFQPALRTNAQGEVTIAFTLPESMTTWNFSALAHDAAMNNGRLDTTLVARKEFMVEPALPRFVRHGDKTMLPVKVTNLSEKKVEATLTLTLEDALHEGLYILKEQQPLSLAAGESKVVSVPFEATTDCAVLICRATATGGGFSDGEEHYLPVLSDLVEVTRTLPFSMTEKGRYTFKTDTLFNLPTATNRALTVELSSNALWYAVTALPVLAGNASCLSATEWATRYYALTLGQYVAEKNPAIRKLAEGSSAEVTALSKLNLEGITDETPWLRNAEANKERTEALKNLFDAELSAAYKATAIDKLKDLQQSDGSWSWYPGMPGNNYITVDVATLLARLQLLADDKEASSLLQKAFSYLRKEVAQQVAEMKKEEKRLKTELQPSELQMRYLYLRSLLGEKPDDGANFLLDRAERLRKEFTMYGKALSAVVLAKAGREDAAQLNLQSLMEHTVSSQEMGRWFDTDRAQWSWRSYRIPTQCAAIEALQHFGKKDECAALRLWLLQSKRTQMWETSSATADAVFTLLNERDDSTTIGQLGETKSLYYTLKKGKEIVGFNAKSQTETPQTVGYFKHTYSDAPAVEATQLQVRKEKDGLSWGSLYATFTVPASEVLTEGKGLGISRRFERQEGTEWKQLTEGTMLRQGDRVRQVFTLTADRDYDFVSLSASRPACLEPVRALSGYQWNDGLSAYRAVHDDRTQYFIEKMRKGTHLFTEELFVDRAGTYTTGTAKIACVFAPEFQGTAASQSLTTE